MEEKAKEQKSTLKKVLNIGYYILLVIILALAVFYMVMTFSTKNGKTSIFGYVIASVQTDSMSGTFESGDVIISKEFDMEADTVEIDDVISFYYREPQSQQLIIVTHRVVDFDGSKVITQGDVARANSSFGDVQYVSRGDIVAKYTGTRIPGLGRFTDFLRTSTGFFCCVLIPVLLFLFWQIYVFVKTLLDAKNLGKEKKINDEAIALAEKMFLEMQQKQQEEQQRKSDQIPPEAQEKPEAKE